LVREIEALCLEKVAVRVQSTDQDLFESGLLDSLLLVQLILELERHFQIELPFSELDLSALRSIDEMAVLIARHQSAVAPKGEAAVVDQLAG
jgi:D-alanine--poly(phosphoribitol) ligase subunit 2